MIRTLTLLVAAGLLGACEQHREPRANCFAFRAALDQAEPDCIFTPLGNPDNGVEV